MEREDPESSLELVEVYGEYIRPRDLLASSAVTLALGVLAYLVAPTLLNVLGVPSGTMAPLAITVGLIGASIGFFVTLAFVKPKRVVVVD